MKVTDLQAYLLSAPLAEPIRTQIVIGDWICYKQDCLVVRIHTDQGLSGYASGPPSANLAQLINRNLKSAVVNIDPVKIETLRKKVFGRRPQFPGLTQAFGLVEAALIDLQGKIEGHPASELLGTVQRRRIPLLARSGLYLDSEHCTEEAVAMSEQGFGTYRFRLGLGYVGDMETLGCLREALPKACRVVADAQAWWQMGNAAYPAAQSEAWVSRLAEHAPLWLAEPFHPDDIQGYQRIGATKRVPIASGENESSSERLQALGESCVDVLQVNVTQLGGMLSGRACLKLLSERGQKFVLTGATTPLEVVALAHLASGFSEENCLGIDWPCFSSPASFSLLAEELLKQPLPIESGSLRVPDGHGFGVEVNESVLHRFPWKSGAASCVV
jgi:L-alanine-DL-glutamate epimerase-like enolase superfamily enzyme